MTRLEEFGWKGEAAPGIARVVRSHGDYYHLACCESDSDVIARKKKGAFMREDASPKPVTGDFVKFVHNPGGESMIVETLERFSVFERRDAGARRSSQTLAVNFDILFITTGLNENYSPARIARFLALAENMGRAKAVLLFTKADLLAPGEGARVAKEACGMFATESLAVSTVSGEGLERLRAMMHPRDTVSFVGSSGVGKSSLVNALAGEDVAETLEVQEWNGKGRHATTSRTIYKLASGVLALDTPGVREIGMIGETETVLAKGVSSHRWRK